jgi:hypothetical protein
MATPGDYAEYGYPRFGAGDVLTVSARVIGSRVGQLLPLTLICMAPSIALQVGAVFAEDIAKKVVLPGGLPALSTAGAFAGVLGLLQLLLATIAQGAVVYTTVESLAGERVTMGEALRVTIRRLANIILTALAAVILQAFGLVMCIVPGIVLMCMYYVAVPAAVTERLGPRDALRRSAALTYGNRGQIFVLLLVLFAVTMAISLGGVIVNLPLGIQRSLTGRVINALLQSSLSVFQTLVSAVFAAVAYARLRGVREGIDAYSLAQVFD